MNRNHSQNKEYSAFFNRGETKNDVPLCDDDYDVPNLENCVSNPTMLWEKKCIKMRRIISSWIAKKWISKARWFWPRLHFLNNWLLVVHWCEEEIDKYPCFSICSSHPRDWPHAVSLGDEADLGGDGGLGEGRHLRWAQLLHLTFGQVISAIQERAAAGEHVDLSADGFDSILFFPRLVH